MFLILSRQFNCIIVALLCTWTVNLFSFTVTNNTHIDQRLALYPLKWDPNYASGSMMKFGMRGEYRASRPYLVKVKAHGAVDVDFGSMSYENLRITFMGNPFHAYQFAKQYAQQKCTVKFYKRDPDSEEVDYFIKGPRIPQGFLSLGMRGSPLCERSNR